MEIAKDLFIRYWKYVVMIVLFVIACSCDIQKQASKVKSEVAEKTSIETITKRKGDSVSYKIPNITFKDTTIYTVNRQGTTLKTVYNESGSIASIDCFASAIEEIKRENREFKESIKDKAKEKTEEFDNSFILYIVIGLVVIVIFALLIMFFYLNKNSKSINQILNNLSK